MIHPLCKLFFLMTALFLSCQAIQFNSSGYFTIVQFTDLHYGTDEVKDNHTQELQRNILSWAKPDLVIISGDSVKTNSPVASGWFQSQWEKFTAPIVEAQIPYAFTLGNDDEEGDLTNRQIVRLDATNQYSIRNESEGIPDTANLRVPVYTSKNESQLAAHLWILDSGSYGCEDLTDGYGCIESDVVDWYNEESKKVKAEHGTNVHHLAYFHIPLPEYLNVYNSEETYGNAGENVYCPMKNTGFFSAAKNNGDIQAMFVGHDHNNDFGGIYEGIELAYGRKGGFGAYGDLQGARVVTLKENYDSEGNLYVTREHYVIDATGSREYSTVRELKRGAKQASCPSRHKIENSGESSISRFSLAAMSVVVFLFCLFELINLTDTTSNKKCVSFFVRKLIE